MDSRTFLSYVVLWTLVALTPGPAVMYSMARATRYGLRSGFAGICGIQAGNLVLFACVALGLVTVLETAAGAFTVLRMAGAAYLFYLGARVIAASFRPPAEIGRPNQTVLGGQSVIQGILIQLTNPKALLFVSALLPQFIDPKRSALLQLTILVLATVGVDMVVLSGYAYAAHRGAASFRKSRFKPWSERAYGAALLYFGSKLLFARK